MGSKKILFIEDDPDLGAMAPLIFNHELYDIDLAHSGQNTLHFLENSECDYAFVFMDMTLPDMSADSLVEKLQSHCRTRNAPIYLASGRDDLASKVRQYGVAGHFRKPYDLSELVAVTETRPE